MSILSDFEDRIGGALEGGFARMFRAPVQPAELARKLGKEMDRGKKLGVGKVYVPTLYNVLLSRQDDAALGGFAETLAGELETYLIGYAREHDYELATRPVVRFLIDKELKLGRFEIIGELLSPEELAEELGYTPDADQFETPREPGSSRLAEEPEPSAPEPIAIEPIAPVVPEPVAVPLAPEPFAPSGGIFDAEALDLDFVPNPAPAIAALEATAIPTGAEQFVTETSEEALATTLLPAAAPTTEPLATVTVKGVDHDVVLRGARVVAGRLQQCDICLADVNASREHAAFEREGDGWALRDLGSTNGTTVNGQRITRQRLDDGDVIVIGITELVYHEPRG